MITINKNEEKSYFFPIGQIKPNRKYKVSATFTGKKGKQFSAFFSVIIHNPNQEEIKKPIRWLNDFSGTPNDYTIIFKAPENSKNAYVGYRINCDTPIKSDIEIQIPDNPSFSFEEINDDVEEQYDQRWACFPKLPELNEADENLLEKNMVWIFGSPRSGTTWLRKLLSELPETIVWNEPHLGAHFRIINSQQTRGDYIFSEYYKNSWLPALRKFLLFSSFQHLRTIKKTAIIKEPNGSEGAPLISQCFPNSKLIFLLRDGRDVVDSLIDAHKPDSWNPDLKLRPLNTQVKRNSEIQKHSDEWKNLTITVERAFENHNPKLRLLVKYEDLRKNTTGELKKICGFLDKSIENRELEKLISRYDFDEIPSSEKGSGKFYRSATPGAWKKNFSSSEQQLMNSIMGKTLAQFDY